MTDGTMFRLLKALLLASDQKSFSARISLLFAGVLHSSMASPPPHHPRPSPGILVLFGSGVPRWRKERSGWRLRAVGGWSRRAAMAAAARSRPRGGLVFFAGHP
ncbi:hypothetical protein PR202_ga11820 [Eleusine coracana subsp. coracana]|uniref:Uncharacterized protein n=1 Tax=Eleusine coracana subsp. coracana TaxID=191504 RepID=A0AAV5CAG2_ELECO|nr:hypothetical protein PR202_ga11820 [Eleusine coracana subsp. coracana]